jgi:hypothetical protein
MINVAPTFQRVPKRRYTRSIGRRVSLSLHFLRHYTHHFVVYILPLYKLGTHILYYRSKRGRQHKIPFQNYV